MSPRGSPQNARPPASLGEVSDLRPCGPDAWLLTIARHASSAAIPQWMALVAELQKEPPQPLREIVPAFDTALLQFEQRSPAPEIVAAWIRQALRGIGAPADHSAFPKGLPATAIAVVFDGADLPRVAMQCGRTIEDTIALFCSGDFLVRCLGFSPGFPYLDGLPGPMHTPRLPTPRIRVPAGSVAIGGVHAGIYPQSSSGGWNLIGRTPETLFNPAASNLESMFKFRPGDTVRFHPLASEAATAERIPSRSPSLPNTKGLLEIIATGMGLSIQDSGRPGFRRFGVPGGGAMDPAAALAANRLLENAPADAVLELCGRGQRFRAGKDLWIAIAGAAAPANRRAIAVRLRAGEALDFPAAPLAGAWTYLAVPGGFSAPRCLGSAAASPRVGLGRLLKAGDRLDAKTESQPAWPPAIFRRSLLGPAAHSPARLRVWPGPQWEQFSESARAGFFQQAWSVSPQSDRTGYRLLGHPLTAPMNQMTSEPVLPGSIQIPPDGMPVVTMPDGPTLGGYPKLGLIDPAGLAAFAQTPPGAMVRFTPI